MTITIKNAELETCRDFLWDLAHKANRGLFNFDSETYQASNDSKAKIAVDELEAHHTIVLSAFKYLNEEPNDQNSAIGHYLVCWLPDHLAALRRLREDKDRALTPHQYQEIGQSLYTLFKDGNTFKRHRGDFENTFWGVQDMKEIRAWLTDTSVMRRVQDERWCNRVQRMMSPAKGYLRCLAHLIVENLLRGRGCNVHHPFYWVKNLKDAVSIHLTVSFCFLDFRRSISIALPPVCLYSGRVNRLKD